MQRSKRNNITFKVCGKEAVVTCRKVIFQYLHIGAEENLENFSQDNDLTEQWGGVVSIPHYSGRSRVETRSDVLNCFPYSL
jgi:hypothetical protein